MKLLHTSDWHLGMTHRSGDYADDQKFFIEKICDIALSNNVEGIIIAGDIFDKSIASQEAINLYDWAMTHICNDLKLKVYIVAGNHDGAERLAQCNAILRNSGLYIAGSLEKEPLVVREGDTDIYLLPWITTDKVRSLFPNELERVSSLEAAYELVLNKYRETFIPGHKNVLVSHSFVVGAETSTSDRSATVGSAAMIGSYVFHDFDYVALGHIHGPQTIKGTDNIRYSGTPMAYSFGREETQEKSVTIIDTDARTTQVILLPYYRLRTTLTGTFEELMAANYSDDIVQGYVRLEVTDAYVGMEAYTQLCERYPRILETKGKEFENEDSKISLTLDELQAFETNPETVFEHYCQDVLGSLSSDREREMFRLALAAFNKEEAEE